MTRTPAPRAAEDSSSEKPDPFFVEIGTRVRKARLEAKLSVPEICQKAGCSPGWLYGVELGRQNFQIFTFRRLLTVLGLEFRDVLALESEVGEKVPNERLNALASRAVLQVGTASQALSEARDIVDKLRSLTEVEKRDSATRSH